MHVNSIMPQGPRLSLCTRKLGTYMLFKLGPIASGYGIVSPPSGKDLLLSNNVVVNPYTTMYCQCELLGLWYTLTPPGLLPLFSSAYLSVLLHLVKGDLH